MIRLGSDKNNVFQLEEICFFDTIKLYRIRTLWFSCFSLTCINLELYKSSKTIWLSTIVARRIEKKQASHIANIPLIGWRIHYIFSWLTPFDTCGWTTATDAYPVLIVAVINKTRLYALLPIRFLTYIKTDMNNGYEFNIVYKSTLQSLLRTHSYCYH